jgi:acetylornithine aminotransferase
MIGLEFDFPVNELRNKLMNEYKIITGSSGDNIIRLLPPLCLDKEDAKYFISSIKSILHTDNTTV